MTDWAIVTVGVAIAMAFGITSGHPPLAHARAARQQPPRDGGHTGQVVDRIVAVVDAQTITQSELLAEARLAVVRRAADAVQASKAPLDGAFLYDFLDYLIGQMLVAREARRVGADDVPSEEVAQELRALMRRFPEQGSYDNFVADLGAREGFVREVLRRDRQNERYLQQRLRTRLAGLGVAASALAPPDEGASAADGAKQDDAAPPLHRRLTASERAAALRAFLPSYLAELRQSVEVRRLNANGVLERELSR